MPVPPLYVSQLSKPFENDYISITGETRAKVLEAMQAILSNLESKGWDVKAVNSGSGDFSVRINQHLRLHYNKNVGLVTFLRIIEDFDDLA